MPLSAVFPAVVAEVPVDRFEIINGPGSIRCMEAMDHLRGKGSDQARYEPLDFTLKTAASCKPFRRTLKVATIFDVRNQEFTFTAVFNGRVVSGIYNMRSRTGWFNLD